jgi:hypothetical protein
MRKYFAAIVLMAATSVGHQSQILPIISHKREALNLSVASNIPGRLCDEPKLFCYSNSDDTPRSLFAPPFRHTCQGSGTEKTAPATRPQEVAENKQPVRRNPKKPQDPKKPGWQVGWLLGGDRAVPVLTPNRFRLHRTPTAAPRLKRRKLSDRLAPLGRCRSFVATHRYRLSRRQPVEVRMEERQPLLARCLQSFRRITEYHNGLVLPVIHWPFV